MEHSVQTSGATSPEIFPQWHVETVYHKYRECNLTDKSCRVCASSASALTPYVSTSTLARVTSGCLLVILIFLTGCQVSSMLFESALECPQIIKPNHKFYGNRNADTLVIFVPGLCGSSEQTWTNQPSGFNFPSELAQDLDDVYVMSFGFASQLERGPSLLSITDHLTFEMDELFRERNYVNIIFIAHSMGGDNCPRIRFAPTT